MALLNVSEDQRRRGLTACRKICAYLSVHFRKENDGNVKNDLNFRSLNRMNNVVLRLATLEALHENRASRVTLNPRFCALYKFLRAGLQMGQKLCFPFFQHLTLQLYHSVRTCFLWSVVRELFPRVTNAYSEKNISTVKKAGERRNLKATLYLLCNLTNGSLQAE